MPVFYRRVSSMVVWEQVSELGGIYLGSMFLCYTLVHLVDEERVYFQWGNTTGFGSGGFS
ncbi:hypothetical protein RHMOL_Rhmol01G0234500 [Rhododendron molle]|uniref:Uncharacterized protein n=1 Tax=Rhododendron molle TaxID=49168 RepID=A0ACC0Q4X7_RHOML|nr:hypothetical protein RHMOL_Rhmol01G0234500 [Rhododendron molle]